MAEVGESLVLIEPGLGTLDWLAPRRRIGAWVARRRVRGAEARNTVRQRLERHELSPDRVAHIVLTHTHPDSMGGVSDFPSACVHSLSDPREDRRADRLPQLAHGNRYVAPSQNVELWHGFRARRLAIPNLEIFLLEMPGHTVRHAGVLLRLGTGYLLHLGHAVRSLDDLLASTSMPKPSWTAVLRQECPFSALLTQEKLKTLVRSPPGPLTVLASAGATARLSLGPPPYPHLVML